MTSFKAQSMYSSLAMEEDITPFSTRRLTFGKFGNRSLPFIE